MSEAETMWVYPTRIDPVGELKCNGDEHVRFVGKPQCECGVVSIRDAGFDLGEFIAKSELESAVIEAAIKYRETGGYLCVETNDAQRGLFAAVDALCEARGSSQDALTSEDRERVPREESK